MTEDLFASLREMEWDATVPEEDIISRTDLWLTRLPRCKWKNKRYWWNNGTDETLAPNPPADGWERGRLKESLKNFKSKVGAQKGIAKNTNRRRDSSGRLLPNK